MIEFIGLHHVSLAVRDLEQSKQFYSGVLGFKELQRPPFNSKGVWYAVGETQQLHLLEHPQGETLRESGVDTVDGHFAMWVSSYSKTIAALDTASVKYEARPDSIAGFSQIYILDLDQNIIELAAAYGS